MPFEMVDAALEESRRVQRRVRDLPARVVVCLLLAGCLFEGLGYPQVWRRLAAGLGGVPAAAPASSAMTQARRRLGPGPLRELFCLLRGPSPHAARWKGLLVCAVDGTIMTVADSPANLAVCFRPASSGETTCAPLLPASLRGDDPARRPELRRRAPGRADRGHQGGVPDPGPDRERRPEAPRPGPAPRRLLALALRRGPDPRRRRRDRHRHQRRPRAARYRLITALADPARYPAGEPAVLYRERWEIETAYFELKSTILGGRVLRARTPDGVEQEVWALLVAYQALRAAIADAAAALPGADPDRASFTIALNAARDQVILAAGVTAGPVIDLAGTIGRTVLASLMPTRRLRTSPRVVKRAISKYNARSTIDRATHKATIDIAIIAAPLDTRPSTLTDRPCR